MRSRRRFAATLAALAGMLFLQAAVAFAPCELPGRSAATARVAAMADMPDCAQAGQADLCLAHFVGEDQIVVKAALELPKLDPSLAVPIAAPPRIFRVASEKPARYLASAGPPLRVRRVSLRL